MTDVADTIRLRFAGPGDTRALAALFVELQDHYGAPHPPPEAIEADLAQLAPGAEILVAETADGALVGLAAYATIYPGPGLTGGLFLKELYITAAVRNLGVGERLMRALARIVRDRNLGRIDWTVALGNAAAQRFYDRLGGVAQDERLFYRLQGEALAALANAQEPDLT